LFCFYAPEFPSLEVDKGRINTNLRRKGTTYFLKHQIFPKGNDAISIQMNIRAPVATIYYSGHKRTLPFTAEKLANFTREVGQVHT
jgi:hypothetical protein